MPIIEHKIWEDWIEKNKDHYGRACASVARKVMEILDTKEGNFNNHQDVHKMIQKANKEVEFLGFVRVYDLVKHDCISEPRVPRYRHSKVALYLQQIVQKIDLFFDPKKFDL